MKNSQGGAHPLLRFIDNNETYGRHIIRKFAIKALPPGGGRLSTSVLA
jgi:hypothetical protein